MTPMRGAVAFCAASSAAGALGLIALTTVTTYRFLPSFQDGRRASLHAQAMDVRGELKEIPSHGMPDILYGTAWKKESTTALVEQAITKGFRGVDTACQPKHYREDLVGQGIAAALVANPHLRREHIFVQTKFTPITGQDPKKVPYDPQAPVEQQVRQSVQKSLENLQVEYIDSLVLHSPLRTLEDTMTAWRTLEEFVSAGVIRRLGVSNCYDPELFRSIFDSVTVKPSVLQNRFYEESQWDDDLRRFCREHSIAYQSFWTLTANRHAVQSPIMGQLSDKYGLTPAQAFYRFVQQQGITPLSGTTSEEHMDHDVLISRTPQGTVWMPPVQEFGNPRAGWEENEDQKATGVADVVLTDQEFRLIDDLMRGKVKQELRRRFW